MSQNTTIHQNHIHQTRKGDTHRSIIVPPSDWLSLKQLLKAFFLSFDIHNKRNQTDQKKNLLIDLKISPDIDVIVEGASVEFSRRKSNDPLCRNIKKKNWIFPGTLLDSSCGNYNLCSRKKRWYKVNEQQ